MDTPKTATGPSQMGAGSHARTARPGRRNSGADHTSAETHRAAAAPNSDPGGDQPICDNQSAPVTAGFDLIELTRLVLATRSAWSLDELVAAVYDVTPAGSIPAAYRVALREFVRHQLPGSSQAGRPLSTPLPGGQTATGAAGHAPSEDHSTVAAGAGQNVERSRAARFRAQYLRTVGFRERVHVGPHLWVPLLECTVQGLTYAADECDSISAATKRAAERYRTLVALMQKHKAATPADLPFAVLQKAFDGNE
jgi:hypothetical protein